MQEGVSDREKYDQEQLSDALSGVVNAAFALGSCLGPIIASSLVDVVGFAWMSVIIAGICSVFVFFFFGAAIFELVTFNNDTKEEDEKGLLANLE